MPPVALAPRALIHKALWPALLAVFYFWGTGYHDQLLGQWGFNPDLYPISIQQTYISACNMGGTLLVHLATTINQNPAPSIALLALYVFAIAASVVVLAWLFSRPIWGVLGKKLTRRTVPRPISEHSPFVRKLVSWCDKIGITGAGVYGTFFAVIVIVVVTTLPPLYAGHIRFQSEWSNKGYEKWAAAAWIDDDGHPKSGHLLTCSDRWCAIFDGTFAVSVPIGQVKLSKRQPPNRPPETKGPA